MSLTNHLPRTSLAFLPTPVHPLDRLSEQLGGPRLWIKRDDQTGLGAGGNKVRKLEFLLGEALLKHADVILTTGAAQSNHCRQTAAAAARLGLPCHLVVNGTPPIQPNGNLLLDQLFGATLHWTNRDGRLPLLSHLSDDLRSHGHHPYPITYGGSDEVGAVGYVSAAEEVGEQTAALGVELDAIVFASSSGGTQAGLMVGAAAMGWDVRVLGISIDQASADLQNTVASLSTHTSIHLGQTRTFQPEEVEVTDRYVGEGYGVLGSLERGAIRTLARAEGILLDPVYTGRAFGGLLAMIRQEIFHKGQNVLFWHTGGLPALFAYADQLK